MPVRMNIALGIDAEVKQYPYRTARVRNHILSFDRGSAQELEERLASVAQAKPDNHTVYEVTHDGRKVYLLFSDSMVILGHDVVVGSW